MLSFLDRSSVEPGHVYLVATPIGNLEDFSFRGVAVLKQVDRILCEDTRQTNILCRAFDIHRPLVSFHAHNAYRRLTQISEWLDQGESLALVSDRGMPSVSDPGQELMVWLYEHNRSFSVIPGASAQVTAFVGSGFPHPYIFWGFLPPQTKARHQRLEVMRGCPYTQVIYEAPHHMDKTLSDLAEALDPNRPLVLGRELTKHFEEYWKGTISVLIDQHRSWQGEAVLVLGPPTSSDDSVEPDWDFLIESVAQLETQGHTTKEAIRMTASQSHVSRRELYNRVQKSRIN